MKTSQKGSAGVVAVILVTLVIAGGAYVYIHKNTPLPAQQTLTQGEVPVSTSDSAVPPAPQAPESDAQLQARLVAKFGPSAQITIRYHDQKTVAYIGITNGKFPELIIADIHTLKEISTRSLLMWGATTTAHYIIGMDGSNINNLVYYKDGASDVVDVPNSQLLPSETYDKDVGQMIPGQEFFFDESTKTFTASVFKPNTGNPNSGSPNKKIRTVKFVLP